jgi:glutamate mutase epsilon subunit
MTTPPAEAKVVQSDQEVVEFVAWSASGIPTGEVIEVREPDGGQTIMKVGSIQFGNAVRSLGQRMPVRRATKEQAKPWRQ